MVGQSTSSSSVENKLFVALESINIFRLKVYYNNVRPLHLPFWLYPFGAIFWLHISALKNT